jgi:hypothetical protein
MAHTSSDRYNLYENNKYGPDKKKDDVYLFLYILDHISNMIYINNISDM